MKEHTKILTKNLDFEDQPQIAAYEKRGGYRAIRKSLGMTQDAIIAEVKASGLRGRGGAGFPTGMKWGFVPRQSPKPKYIMVNADESEPGTCKDRLLIEYDPHLMIEGIIIAGLAVGAQQGYVYIRGEYRYLIDIVDRAIDEAYASGYLGDNVLGRGVKFHLAT